VYENLGFAIKCWCKVVSLFARNVNCLDLFFCQWII